MESAPELYSEEELKTVENHIEKHFGDFASVFHELVSPDIHADICVINPTKKHDYYTLVTMGMGAHKMNVPPELKDKKIDRAEIIVTLPKDWQLQNSEEEWYWPLRWLKILARLPIENNTWLGWGHSVPNGEPFAKNTQLCSVMLEYPYFFGKDSITCALPGGDEVNFYQMLPLYESEMSFKIKNGAEKLEELFDDSFNMVIDINRKNFCEKKKKRFFGLG